MMDIKFEVDPRETAWIAWLSIVGLSFMWPFYLVLLLSFYWFVYVQDWIWLFGEIILLISIFGYYHRQMLKRSKSHGSERTLRISEDEIELVTSKSKIAVSKSSIFALEVRRGYLIIRNPTQDFMVPLSALIPEVGANLDEVKRSLRSE